jgi:hypothetical protein
MIEGHRDAATEGRGKGYLQRGVADVVVTGYLRLGRPLDPPARGRRTSALVGKGYRGLGEVRGKVTEGRGKFT